MSQINRITEEMTWNDFQATPMAHSFHGFLHDMKRRKRDNWKIESVVFVRATPPMYKWTSEPHPRRALTGRHHMREYGPNHYVLFFEFKEDVMLYALSINDDPL